MFVNLLVRSYYSLGISALSVDNIINYAIENNCKYVCLIDENVMYGALEFYQKVIANKLKPIIGLSFTFEKTKFILIAKNYSGYLILCKISSLICHNTKFDLKNLLNKDLIVICNKSINWVNKDYYDFNQLAIHESLFASANDYAKYKAILAINSNCLYSELKDDSEIAKKYLLSQDEAKQLFSQQQIDLTYKILESVNLTIDLNNKNNFVVFDKNKNSKNLLEEQCRQGLIKRFGQKIDKKYIDRIKYELDIIHKMGFDDYFLVVQDYVSFAKQKNIMVGPGRGSAAGSLVSYALGITNIDPIKYNLIFERFLNVSRKTKPDIDIDFMDNRRHEIIDYLFSKYGHNNVAHIITFQKIKMKTAIRDIARILDIELSIVNLICKSISDYSSETFDEYKKNNSLFSKYMDKYPQLFELAKYIIDLPRQIGIHAAGIVISNEPLDNIIPTTISAEGFNTTQYSMEYIESVGLIKVDILGLVNLSIINDCIDEIKKNENKIININSINLLDLNVFKQLWLGNTIGIFQLESPGMTRVVQRIEPKSIEDISIALALFRPGPLSNISTYIENKKNKDNIEYIDNNLIPIIAPTYGIIIYQEQVIQTLRIVANWSLSESDIFRRIISKKKINDANAIRDKFVKCAISNGYLEKKANEIFRYLMKFANYGFNHSHSISYALISYQMAYLKTHFPLEFYACLLTYNNNSSSKINQYLVEAKKNAIEILPPDINVSKNCFSLFNKKIIFGLNAIKGLGSESISKILLTRSKSNQWTNLIDCFKDLINNGIGQTTLSILAKAGAFDKLLNANIPNRTSLIASINEIYTSLKSFTKKYGFLKEIKYKTIQTNEENKRDENKNQFDVLGFCFSIHPIIEIKNKNKDLQYVNLNDAINKQQINQQCYIIAYVKTIKKIKTKTGIDMAFITLEDESMILTNVVCFNNILKNQQYASMLLKDNILYMDVTKTSKNLKINKILKELK